jgi:hypothetical protein
MIEKLFKFKKVQLEQQLVAKRQLETKIFEIDEKIIATGKSLATAGVKMFGSIGDFKVLAIHKNSMRFEIEKFEREKKSLRSRVEQFDKVIIEFQKELEQYGYILKEDMKKQIKKQEKNDEMVANEYVQAKWIQKYE